MSPRTQSAIVATICWVGMIGILAGSAIYHGHGWDVARFVGVVGGVVVAIALAEAFYPWGENK